MQAKHGELVSMVEFKSTGTQPLSDRDPTQSSSNRSNPTHHFITQGLLNKLHPSFIKSSKACKLMASLTFITAKIKENTVPWLTLSKTTNFRLFQNQIACRRQFQV